MKKFLGNGYSRYSSRVQVSNCNSTTTMRDGRNGRLRGAVEPPEFEQYFNNCNDRRSSYDPSVDCRFEKPRKHSSVKRHNKQIIHQSVHQINDRRAVSSRNNKYFSVSRSAPYGHEHIYKNGGNFGINSSNLTSEDIRSRGNGQCIKRYNGVNNDFEDYDDEEDEDEDEEEEEDDDDEDGFDTSDNKKDDYTPVPVKELIKEFEKSCRPSMQYKRNGSGKIAAQLCALDSEAISRYFEGRGYASNSNKRNGDNGRAQNEWKEARRREQNPGARIHREEEEQQSTIPDSRRCLTVNNSQEDPRQRDWRMKYIENGDDEEEEDEEDDTSTGDNSSDSSCSPNQNLIGTFDDNQSYFPVRREFPINYDEENLQDICPQICQQINGDETGKPVNNTQILIDNNEKSLVLAMVASEEDIMNTLKHLRRTPVLNNLIPETGSTDLSTINGEVGKLTRMRFFYPLLPNNIFFFFKPHLKLNFFSS